MDEEVIFLLSQTPFLTPKGHYLVSSPPRASSWLDRKELLAQLKFCVALLLHSAGDNEEGTRENPKSFLEREDHKGKKPVVVQVLFWCVITTETWLSSPWHAVDVLLKHCPSALTCM